MIIPVNTLFSERLMINTGIHQDFLTIENISSSAFTVPSVGVTFASNDTGFHFRTSATASYRNFKLTPKQDSTSSLKISLGPEYIFKPILEGVYPFIFTSFQYHFSEEKQYMGQSGSYPIYNYIQMKNLSIPISFGFFLSLSRYFIFSLESELDFLSFYSSYQDESKGQSGSYRELNFAFYFGIGIKY